MPTHRWGRAHPRPGVLSCLIALALIMPGPTFAASRIVIGEVNWAGSSRSTADEWIELWNLGSQDQSLDGWRLEGASATPFVFDKTEIVPAQQSFLIANYDEANTKSALNVHPAVVSTDVAISNDALALRLSDEEGNLVDQAGNGKAPNAGTTKPPTSMVRVDVNTNGQDPSAWANAKTTENFDAGVSDQGTPGICDGCGRAVSSTEPQTGPPIITDASSTVPKVDVTTSTNMVLPLSTTSTVPIASTSTTDVTVTSTSLFVPVTTTSTSSFATTTVAFTAPTSTKTSATTTLEKLDATSSMMFAASTTTVPVALTSTTTISSTTTTIASVHSAQADSPPPTTIATNVPITCRARFETIFPAPSSGSEWVELSGCDTPESLAGWSIHDPQGPIATLTASTNFERADAGHLRFPLPGQHLNNSGDTVLLRGPDGGLYDIVAYPALKHDEHYARREDGTWWIPERAPTAVVASAPAPAPTTIAPDTKALVVQDPVTTNTKQQPLSSATAPAAAPASTRIVRAASVTSVALDEYLTHLKIPNTPPKLPIKKPSKAKPTQHMAASSSPQTPRVLLHGVVGTPPNLIAKRRFVLLNAEGKGILVYANNLQPSPALGQRVDITGSLITNDDGPHLEMRTRDRWQLSRLQIPDPVPTPPDPLSTDNAPSWSLVELTGRVDARNGNTIHLIAGDDEIDLMIPSSLGYRSARLAVGDQLHLFGLLDTSRQPPRLYPRTANEIAIVEQASAPANALPTNTHDSLPPWVPVSAAGTTVALGYGVRRLRKWYEDKRLAQQLSTAIEQLSSS